MLDVVGSLGGRSSETLKNRMDIRKRADSLSAKLRSPPRGAF